MRICSPQIALDEGAYLGGTVYDRELLAALARAGCDVTIPVVHPPKAVVPGWHVSRVRQPYKGRGAGALLQAAFLRGVARAGRRRRFDFVRVFENRYFGAGAIAYRRATGTPFFTHYHHLEGEPGRFDRLSGLAARRADAVVVLSEFTRGQVTQRYGVPERRCVVSYCGVGPAYRPSTVAGDAARRRFDLGRPLVVTVGVVRRRKNIEYLIRAMSHVEAVLVVAGPPYGGEPDYEPSLRKLAADAGVGDRVVFTGYVSEDDKVGLYNAANAFVTSSRREGFGMAPLEAMACGTPVVALANGAIPEVVTESSGVLLAPDATPDAFATALSAVVDDGPLRASLSAGALRRASELTWDATAARVIEGLEDVLRRRRA